MSAQAVGRRYERLLFFAGPLSLVSLLVFLVASATASQSEFSSARCYTAAASAVESNLTKLDAAWNEQRQRIDAQLGASSDYRHLLTTTWVGLSSVSVNCFSQLLNLPDSEAFRSPETLVAGFRAKADSAFRTPIRVQGLEMPETATISVFGTPLKMQLITLTQSLQIGLAPVLLLWLGSLYNTRQRETLYVRRMSDVRQLFPHIVNVYPVGSLPAPRKRSWGTYYSNAILVRWLYPILRMALVSMFVGPPVAFYLFSLYFMPMSTGFVSLAIGTIVGMFAFFNLAAELLLWHFGKRFHEPLQPT